MGLKNLQFDAPDSTDGVTKDQIKGLVNKYLQTMHKQEPGGPVRALNGAGDSKCAWFSKEKLDALFSQNDYDPAQRDKYGLRIYFAVNDSKILPGLRPGYDNQQTVILVVTRKLGDCNIDQLIPGSSVVEVLGANSTIDVGEGLDHGTLCPPEKCECIDIP